jgi:hypothetical protein
MNLIFPTDMTTGRKATEPSSVNNNQLCAVCQSLILNPVLLFAIINTTIVPMSPVNVVASFNIPNRSC